MEVNFTKESGTKPVEYEVEDGSSILSFVISYEEGGQTSWITTDSTEANKLKISVKANTSSARIGYITPKFGDDECKGEDKILIVNQEGEGSTTPKATIRRSQLSENGATEEIIGEVSSSESFYSSNLMAAAPDWIDITFTEPINGTSNILATYSYAQAPRLNASVKILYANQTIGYANLSQDPSDTTPELSYEISDLYSENYHKLNPCGGYKEKIGEYYYTDGFNVNNSELHLIGYVDKPSWLQHIEFGVPSGGTGDILLTYETNNGTDFREYKPSFSYDGYGEIKAKNYVDAQHKGGYILRQAETSTDCSGGEPQKLPTQCGDANFYHWHHPYANNYDYYVLQHELAADAQQYILGTYTSYIDDKGEKASSISNNMWKNVKVEVYEVKPIMTHRSHCGEHYVSSDDIGKDMEETKANHEPHCPCTFAPQSGEYVVVGYDSDPNTMKLKAHFENGDAISSDTSFWLTVDNGVNEKIPDNYSPYRGVSFHVAENKGSDAVERYALIKIYPYVGNYNQETQECNDCVYCNDNGCIRTGDGCINACVTDLVKQLAVDCGKDEEYVYINAHVNSLKILGYDDYEGYDSKDSGRRSQGMYLYTYNGTCPNEGENRYIDTVEIFELSEETTFTSESDPSFPTRAKCETYGVGARIIRRIEKYTIGDNITPIDWHNYDDYTNVSDDMIKGVAFEEGQDAYVRVQVDRWSVTHSTTQKNQRYRYRGFIVYNSKKYKNVPTPYIDENNWRNNEQWGSYTNKLDVKYCNYGKIQQSNVYDHFEYP